MEIIQVREDPSAKLLLIRGNVLEDKQSISILALKPNGEVLSIRNCGGWSLEGTSLLPSPTEVEQEMKDSEPVLGWPMIPGSSLRSSLGNGMPGATYRWNVNDVRTLKARIPGWSARGQVFTLIYASGPSHEIVEFVPGLGFTRVFSVHHGTAMEREARLVSFKPGKR
jgi:hypothetical protein